MRERRELKIVFLVYACVCQINKENGMLEASRIMNLYQFIQLYHDITSQAAEVLSSAEHVTEGPSGQLPSADSCQASMWMGRLECTIYLDVPFVAVYLHEKHSLG